MKTINIKSIVNNNYIFSVLTKIYVMLSMVAISALQVRFLGPDLNGQMAYIKGYTTILNTVFVFGIHQSYAHYRKKYGKEFQNAFLGSAFLLLGFYVLIFGIILLIVRPTFVYAVILITIPILFFVKIVRYVTMVEDPKTKNKVELFVYTSKLVFLLFLFLFVQATQIWILIVLLFEEILLASMYWKKMNFHPLFDKDSFRVLIQLLTFGFIPMLNLLLNSLNYRVDVLMLKRATTYAQLSLYSVAVNFAEECWAIPDAIRDILLSKLSNGKEESEVTMIIRFSNTFTFVMQIGMLIFGKLAIWILFGPDYSESYFILTIAMLGSYGMIYSKMIGVYNVVNAYNRVSFLVMLFTAALNIVLNYVLIPHYGSYGAAIASVISYNICGLIFALFFCHVTGVRIRDMIMINKGDIQQIKKLILKKRAKNEERGL